jgi:hypothetical protein
MESGSARNPADDAAGGEEASGATREPHKCCGEPLHWLIAESARGVEVARRVEVNRGIPFRLWRCAWCEGVTYEGWVPPTWISAVARACEEIRRELEAELARAYEPQVI